MLDINNSSSPTSSLKSKSRKQNHKSDHTYFENIYKMDTRLRSIVVFQFILANFLPRNFLAKADSFASISQLQKIVNLETKLSESLETFVKLEKNRLDKIKNFAENVKEATELVKRNGVSYPLENPMTSYALIKRFANGWSELSEFLNRDYSQGKSDT